MARELTENPSLVPWFSIGLDLTEDGTISDVGVGSIADKAGFAPGQKITAINGRVFDLDLFTETLKASKGKATPIQLLVQDEDTLTPVTFTYSEGLRYPHLTRIPNTPDLLTEILTPSTPATKP
jgi:predicted metalloprotease with PDZ domain